MSKIEKTAGNKKNNKSSIKEMMVETLPFAPKVSVIIPVYNVGEYLFQCLKSCIGQSLKEIEIVCVDDGSTDISLEILKYFYAIDKRVRVIQEENKGAGFARNTAMDIATGEFIFFMDGDDYFPADNTLELLYTKAKDNNVLIAGGSLCEDHDDGRWIRTDFDKLYSKYTFDTEGIMNYSDYQFHYGYYRFIFNRELLDKNGIRFPMYRRYQDPPFFVEAMAKAEKFYAVKDCTYCYRFGHQNVNWDMERIIGFIQGHIDILKTSAENKMADLHTVVYKGLVEIGAEQIKKGMELDKESTSEILEEALRIVDKTLLPSDVQIVSVSDFTEEADAKLKILVSYHKPEYLLKDEVLLPVHAGKKNAKKQLSSDDYAWMDENMVGDDSGDNISELNPILNELTTIYWAWKNADKINNPKYIGHIHYRRHFILDENGKNIDELCLDKKYFDKIKYSEEKILRMIDECDFITVKPQYRKSVVEHFMNVAEPDDMLCLIDVIRDLYPDYYDLAIDYMNGKEVYFCNMFIFKRDIFQEYCSWIFGILDELMKRCDFTNKRMYLSEILTGIFITKLISDGKKGKFLPMSTAESRNTIPIVFSTDARGIFPAAVATKSLLDNAFETTTYRVNYLLSNDVDEDQISILRTICEENRNCEYHFWKMGDSYENVDTNVAHITYPAFFRLEIPRILKDEKQCIYLDIDTIIKKDLSCLYRMNIGRNYIAGVKAYGYFQNEKQIKNKCDELGIKAIDTYVNSGVLLMNLDEMRKNDLMSDFKREIDSGFANGDQDILNKVCFGRTRLIHFKFNVMTKYNVCDNKEYDNNKWLKRIISKGEWDAGRKNPTIIHYADRKKPWNDLGVDFADVWWNTAAKLPLEIRKRLYEYYGNPVLINSSIGARNTPVKVASNVNTDNSISKEQYIALSNKIDGLILRNYKKNSTDSTAKFMIEELLRYEDNYDIYFNILKQIKNDYMILVSARDTVGSEMPLLTRNLIKGLGFTNLNNAAGFMYVGAIDYGKVICNKASKKVSEKVEYEDTKRLLKLTSEAYKNGDKAKIIINKTDYSINKRGLNIVVYDKLTNRLVDSVNLDTHVIGRFRFEHNLSNVKRMFPLDEKNDIVKQDSSKSSVDNAVYVEKLEADLNHYRYCLDEVWKSKSFKVGRVITWPFRMIRQLYVRAE